MSKEVDFNSDVEPPADIRESTDQIQTPLINPSDENSPTDHEIQAVKTNETHGILDYIKDKFKAGSLKGSIFTLITATIGTGILVIPNSVAASGLLWGEIQFTLCGLVGFYSLILIVKCARAEGVYSYQALAYNLYGAWYRYIVNLVFFIANWGTTVAYIILTCQLLSTVCTIFFQGYQYPSWLQWVDNPKSFEWAIALSTFCALPLSLPKELKSLRYFCLASFFFVLYLVCVVFGEAFTYNPSFNENWEAAKIWQWNGISTTLPTAVFAYLCHPNVLDVFKELNNNTIKRMNTILTIVVLIVFFTYTMVGIFGYLGMARALNVLDNQEMANGIILLAYGYSPTTLVQSFNIPLVICIMLIAFSVTIAIPLNVKPSKDGLRDLIFPNAKTTPDQDPLTMHIPLVVFVVYSAMFIGHFVPGMQTAINILGGSAFSVIAFIMPATFYLKIGAKKYPGKINFDKIMSWFLIIFFVPFSIWATYVNIPTGNSEGGEGEGAESSLHMPTLYH